MFSYKIAKNNVVEIYRSTSETPETPVLTMANWPNGTAWANKAEAEAWATLFVDSQAEGATHRPGDSPEEPSVEIVIYVPPVAEVVEETPALEAPAAE